MSDLNRVLSLFRPGSTVTAADLRSAGLARPTLFRVLKSLLENNSIERVRHGAYRLASVRSAADERSQLMDRFPGGVLCLASALTLHKLMPASPMVWLALPRGTWRSGIEVGRVRFVSFSGDGYSEGIEIHEHAGVQLRAYSCAKTVADCFKLRNTIGIDLALRALKDGWRDRKFTLDELDHMARINRVQRVIEPYVRALLT